MEGAIRAEIIHHAGARETGPYIVKNNAPVAQPELVEETDFLLLRPGKMQARIDRRANSFQITYEDAETGLRIPGDLYGATKAATEMYLIGFNQYYGGQGVYAESTQIKRNIIRPGYTFSNPAYKGGASNLT